MSRRVVVTGLGVVSPLGNTLDESWEGIKAGKSGLGAITRYDTSNYNVKVAGELKDWDPARYMPAKEVRRRDPYQHYIIAALQQALEQSGFTVDEAHPGRTGTIVGSSVGGVNSYYDVVRDFLESNDSRRITPFGIPMLMVNGGSDLVSIMTGARGPSYTPTSACATGADCIGHAFDLIQLGKIDSAIAGGSDAPIFPVAIAAFDRTRACSRVSEGFEGASRPFDKNRTGLVFGEGAGVMILETLERAQARNATILGEMVGYGSTSDAYHITAPHPEAKGAIEAITMALENAKLDPTAIDYINAHGTATALNDPMETMAVKAAFGNHAYQLAMSSTKSMTGHAMGATAALEAIFTVLALRDQVAPPTINYETPDPECDLDYVPNTAREMPMRYAMSNAFGFGGHNVSLIFKRFE